MDGAFALGCKWMFPLNLPLISHNVSLQNAKKKKEKKRNEKRRKGERQGAACVYDEGSFKFFFKPKPTKTKAEYKNKDGTRHTLISHTQTR